MMDNSITSSILKAQEDAEKEADQLELLSDEDKVILPSVPKLLETLSQDALIEKTHEFKTKGKQLDLLLLKAESYSHFISENQKRTLSTFAPTVSSTDLQQLTNDNDDDTKTPSKTGSKRKSSSKDSSSTKKVRNEKLASPPISVDEESSKFFSQPPNLIGGKLLPYQLDGLQWLLSLWENGLSGILADEMGLGKTIQIISLIAHLRHSNTSGPFLIAAPLATIPNWVNEFHKWLPSCPVIMYHGSKAEREQLRRKYMAFSNQKNMDFPVVITSFEICMIDRSHLERYTWQYLILDEGHRIKNRNCRLVRELKSIRSVSRLLLTGTPIQNTLEELWSLLNFCCPAVFDDLQVFQSWFGFKNIGHDTQVDDIIGKEQQERIVYKLHEILRPFLLRRMKKDVLLNMPPKKEIVIYCPMTTLQKAFYTRVLDGSIRDTLVSMNIENGKDVSLQNMQMNLRKVCNHPFLFGEPRDDDGIYLGTKDPRILITASGKFRLLERMLPLLKQNGHKVLIFSQMTELLNILEDYINVKGYQYCRLDGSTKVIDRQKGIDKFNKDPNVFLFLLSTRAGGLGINLTAADTCILFDSDFNPHQDSQAQDRCHRIGQSKPVVVYRLLTPGSVEIEMMERQISKKKLERLAVYGGDFRQAGKRAGSELTLSNIRKLLEDDVKNLSRMSSSTASGSGSGGVQSVLNDTKKEDISQYTEISQHELSMLMNRDLLFVKTIQSSDAASRVPTPTSVAATIHESALSPKPNKLDSASIDAKLLSSDTKKKSVTKVVKSSPSKTQSTPSDMQTTDIKTTTASATDGGGGTALDALGNEEHRLITYEVNEKVPIEGAMYDIICIDPNQISGMLQGFNV